MNEFLQLTIPGEPVAKGRARAVRRGNFISHYTPEKTAKYENLVKLAAQIAMQENPPIEVAVAMTVSVFLSIPVSWSIKKQKAAEVGEITPTKRPDLDNIIKSIKDGLNGVVWRDDSQVVNLIASKRYSLTPRVDIIINKLLSNL